MLVRKRILGVLLPILAGWCILWVAYSSGRTDDRGGLSNPLCVFMQMLCSRGLVIDGVMIFSCSTRSQHDSGWYWRPLLVSCCRGICSRALLARVKRCMRLASLLRLHVLPRRGQRRSLTYLASKMGIKVWSCAVRHASTLLRYCGADTYHGHLVWPSMNDMLRHCVSFAELS